MKTIRISSRKTFLTAAVLSLACLTTVALDPLPELAISLSNGNVNLSWSTNFPDFMLESVDHLGETWTAVSNITGYSATLPVTTESRFFRLRKTVAITYVANEGFLMCGGGNKVMVDAIFTGGGGTYYTPPSDVLAEERTATAPFDKVDAVLITHSHSDHFKNNYVVQHMTNDPAAILIGSPQVSNALAGVSGFAQITNRLIVATPAPGSTVEFPIAGIDFKVLPLQHAADPSTNVQMVGFLFTIGGLRVFHPGDSALNLQEYQTLNLADENIDVFFTPFWLFDDSQNAQAIINYINPKTVIAMHVPIGQSDYYRNLINAITNIPPVYLMDTNMVTLRIPVGGE
jgi:L-ascorbate metabolism protein UlaG (beta-lactamase superfamily)